MNRTFAALLGAVIALGGAASASGQTLNVAINEAEILRLDQPASLVMVANPNIADVAIETDRMLFLVGRRPGETKLIVLDAEGREILVRPLVVTEQAERHVTVHRGTRQATFSCDPRCLTVRNPERGSGVAGAGVAAGGEEEEEAAPPPAQPSAADIAAAAAAAAVAAQKPAEQPAK